MAYARALAEQPGGMIPELFTRKYDIDATYELLGRREATPDARESPGLNDTELEVLGLAAGRTLTTVASVLLGRLGGHMNRKTLRLLVRGAELERMRNDRGVHTYLDLWGCIFPGMANGPPVGTSPRQKAKIERCDQN